VATTNLTGGRALIIILYLLPRHASTDQQRTADDGAQGCKTTRVPQNITPLTLSRTTSTQGPSSHTCTGAPLGAP